MGREKGFVVRYRIRQRQEESRDYGEEPQVDGGNDEKVDVSARLIIKNRRALWRIRHQRPRGTKQW